MLAPGAAVVCGDPISSGLARWLRAAGIELIEAGSQEAMELGVNVLSLGDGKVLSAAGETDLNDRIRAHGFEVLDPALDAFTLGGGGAHCLTQPLVRDPA
jgi:N-dimethylarginine dimethylaminohydrolase